MTLDPTDLRKAMRSWTTGVTVVTARHGAAIHGMTVSSFTSVSLTPPLVLVSVAQGARTHTLIEQSGAFAVSILSAEQQDISNRFANPEMDTEERFDGVAFTTLETGAPVLTGSLAWVDCRVVAAHTTGTHTVFIGEVAAVQSAAEGQPLLYFNRGYRHLAD